MKNVHMCYIRVIEGKIENLKTEGKTRVSSLIFIYTIHLHNTQNFIILNQVVAEKTDKKRPYVLYIGVTEGKIEKEG